jgi:molecular chaperone GrpE
MGLILSTTGTLAASSAATVEGLARGEANSKLFNVRQAATARDVPSPENFRFQHDGVPLMQDNDRHTGSTSVDGRDNDEKPTDFKVFDKRFWAEDAQPEREEQQRATMPTYVQQLQNQVEEKDRKLREYIAAYKTEVEQNLEQTKQRLERDAEQKIKALRGEFAAPMMDVLEALERSLQTARTNADPQAVAQGLDMLTMLMAKKLEELGLERIETVGHPFDPTVHEAVAVVQVSDPGQNGTVTAELSPGFRCDGRVVRAAKVQVGKQ